MFPTDTHLRAVKAVDAIYDRLVARGAKPFDDPAWKRRDPKEPGRAVKEAYEDKLYRLVMRYFRAQAERIRENLEEQFPTRKSRKSIIIPDDLLDDPEIQARMYMALVGMSQHGVELFANNISLGFDIGRFSISATEIARRNVANLVTKVDETTKEAIRKQVVAFYETPGMTIGQLIESLPFGPVRARMIAVTEVTNLYAGVENEMGRLLQEEYPGVKVVKTWFTNNDDRVCQLCGPLHMVTVPVNSYFNGDYEYPPAHVNCRCWHSVTTVIE